MTTEHICREFVGQIDSIDESSRHLRTEIEPHKNKQQQKQQQQYAVDTRMIRSEGQPNWPFIFRREEKCGCGKIFHGNHKLDAKFEASFVVVCCFYVGRRAPFCDDNSLLFYVSYVAQLLRVRMYAFNVMHVHRAEID